METFNIVLGGLMVVLAAYIAYRDGVRASYSASNLVALAERAKNWVGAAEQLYETGRVPRDERFEWVYKRIQAEFPKLTEDTLAGAIESAVAWYKLLKDRAGS